VRELQAETEDELTTAGPAPATSTFGTPFDLNLIGLWTLYRREVRRFLKVPGQTIAAPLVTVMMFLLVFSVALGRAGREIEGVPFIAFLGPGLVMMAIMQNAFANTSSSIMIGKVQGNIIDVLMPPFRPSELLFGIIAGGVTRGLMVAVVVTLALALIAGVELRHPALALFYVLSGAMMLALLGFLGGLWAEKFDQMAAVTNFVITPLSFLSGTFYSINQLPEAARVIAHGNPFFYLIDGLRFGFLGQSDGSILLGMAAVTVVNAGLWSLAFHLLKRGYRIKA
jgi:ABC-2 type transport system permease protein